MSSCSSVIIVVVVAVVVVRRAEGDGYQSIGLILKGGPDSDSSPAKDEERTASSQESPQPRKPFPTCTDAHHSQSSQSGAGGATGIAIVAIVTDDNGTIDDGINDGAIVDGIDDGRGERRLRISSRVRGSFRMRLLTAAADCQETKTCCCCC